MRIIIEKASDWKYEEYRTIKGDMDILKLLDEFGESIIIEKPYEWEKEPDFDYRVIIYDGYME